MRLFELIDYTPRTSVQGTKYVNKVQKATNAKELGAGAFGTTYDTGAGTRLNQVTKVGNAANFGDAVNGAKEIKQDGYLSYIHYAIEYEKSGKRNSYFPVVHDLKIMKDSYNKLTYRVNLARLTPYDTPGIIKDPKLVEAMDGINNIIKSNSVFFYDMHDKNIMWRITGKIPELVIIDPVA